MNDTCFSSTFATSPRSSANSFDCTKSSKREIVMQGGAWDGFSRYASKVVRRKHVSWNCANIVKNPTSFVSLFTRYTGNTKNGQSLARCTSRWNSSTFKTLATPSALSSWYSCQIRRTFDGVSCINSSNFTIDCRDRGDGNENPPPLPNVVVVKVDTRKDFALSASAVG